MANGRIRQCIVDPERTAEIEQIVAEGEYYGMQTFDQSLANLLAKKRSPWKRPCRCPPTLTTSVSPWNGGV